MDLQAAVETPAFQAVHRAPERVRQTGDVAPASLVVEDRFPRATLDALARRGHRVRVVDGWSEGGPCACTLETTAGGRILGAAADPRRMQDYALAR